MLLALQPGGPFPILYICGEYGCLLAEAIRSVIDPHSIPVRAVPQNIRDLKIAAFHTWLVILSGSHIRPWLADGVCSLYFGTALGTRGMYADIEEVVLGGRHPVIVVGDDRTVSQPNLLASMLTLNLPSIAARQRKSDCEMRGGMRALRGPLFGYLLDALSCILAVSDHREPILPQLTEFAALGARAELILWPPGSFMRAYAAGRAANSPVVKPLLEFGRSVGNWNGTATVLLNMISAFADPEERDSCAWPEDAANLGKQLRALKPILEELGIMIEFTREAGGDRERLITLGTDQ